MEILKFKRGLFILVTFTILIAVITGCSNRSSEQQSVHITKNPDANEILELQPDADFFQWESLIYLTDIDWVEELELTKDKQIGEITHNTTNPNDFTNGTANKLPVGAIIFSVKEDGGFLIVEDNQKQIKYMSLVEG